ncbi:hypothetical protein GH714_005822 [Hevea brasiliensis]|uniref:PPM-type phosphatase domain-containing protein n=1 Tax=Hevea brasiliensis TaxID=3981 RepID=A0A6A6KHQ5_HEVBR|nr:hypothetical protein GH714_005822 [Hevea brasiliensis]
MKSPLVPLGTLIGRELRNEKVEKPFVKYGQAALAKKGEDYFLIKPDCQRIPGDSSTSFSVFAIFDGHNGISAAIFAKENLLDNVLSAIPQEISREEWLQALPSSRETSGTTVTFVVIDGWTVTVASVGDSRCILDTQGGVVSLLTVDHRLEENAEERERVTASGGEVGRLNVFGGNEVGPLRCWPGGLCLSRSIGDTDVGEFIVPIPHVKQVKLSSAGGRLIIASDGIWDALSSDVAAKCCREALRSRGLKDDTTCLVVDIIPSDVPVLPSIPRKKQNMLSSLLFGKKSLNSVNKATNKLSAVGVVEELFEEGSAMLAERLGKDFPSITNSGLYRCAAFQQGLAWPNGLISHQDSGQVGPLRCWPGGLCLSTSIGDTDVGNLLFQYCMSSKVKSDVAAKCSRGLPAELAAKLVVKEALRSRGLKDDKTCLAVDIIPSDVPVLPSIPRKTQNMLSSLLFGKKSLNSVSKATNKLSAVEW